MNDSLARPELIAETLHILMTESAECVEQANKAASRKERITRLQRYVEALTGVVPVVRRPVRLDRARDMAQSALYPLNQKDPDSCMFQAYYEGEATPGTVVTAAALCNLIKSLADEVEAWRQLSGVSE